MRLSTVQILAALIAAVALCLAFMAIGAGILGLLLAAIGSIAVGWLVWSLLRRLVSKSRKRAA